MKLLELSVPFLTYIIMGNNDFDIEQVRTF